MSTSPHEHPHLGPPQLIEVADRVFAYVQPDGSWYINNTGFVVADRSVISIDACSTERRTREYVRHIRSVTSAPIDLLVNTPPRRPHVRQLHRRRRCDSRARELPQ
jgi:cyclase